MIGGQGKDYCGRSGTGETPQEAQRPPAESDVLHGNQLRGHKLFSSCIPFVLL
ncbi:hypothetical protein ABE036_18390 [Priestia aryabhattai]|uniref:hypothetical protein n=1 Tax=Priestia aryabhattai TaxID=412384 RepID=UPI003D2825BE